MTQPHWLIETDLAAFHTGRNPETIYRWAREGKITRHGGPRRNQALWDIRELPAWAPDSGLPRPLPPNSQRTPRLTST